MKTKYNMGPNLTERASFVNLEIGDCFLLPECEELIIKINNDGGLFFCDREIRSFSKNETVIVVNDVNITFRE